MLKNILYSKSKEDYSMEFTCKRCTYKTNLKANLKRHLESKIECRVIDQDISREEFLLELYPVKEVTKVFTCKCGKVYSHAQSLSKHKKTCDFRKAEETPELLKMVQDLQEEVERLKRDGPKIIHNTTNNITNNLILNDFGKENIDYITEAFVQKCLRQQDHGFVKLTEKIHFNDNHPENKNVVLPNKREPYLQVVEKGKKILKPKKEVIDDLIINIGNILDEQLQYVVDELKKNWVKNERMARELDTFMKQVFEDDSNVRKRLTQRVYLLLVNNR